MLFFLPKRRSCPTAKVQADEKRGPHLWGVNGPRVRRLGITIGAAPLVHVQPTIGKRPIGLRERCSEGTTFAGRVTRARQQLVFPEQFSGQRELCSLQVGWSAAYAFQKAHPPANYAGRVGQPRGSCHAMEMGGRI